MSENSLKIRGKFIGKINSKLEELKDDLELLSKVDRKIFKKITTQKGGADIDVKELQLEALRKRLELARQQTAIDRAAASIAEINAQIGPINEALTAIKNQIAAFNITIPDDFNDTPGLNKLEDAEIGTIQTALTAATQWGAFQTANTALATKVSEGIYRTLYKAQTGADHP
jgi:hypothetical protein